MATRYLFENFYHPHVCAFIKQLNRDGIDGLLQSDSQPPTSTPVEIISLAIIGGASLDQIFELMFRLNYKPNLNIVDRPLPYGGVEFTYGDAYSLYNWELFFHAPMLIADRLSKNQRFEEAQKWFHYIFDPTNRDEHYDSTGHSVGVPGRYWGVRPFWEYNLQDKKSKPIQELLKLLSEGDAELAGQVEEWKRNAFKPHLVARLRPIAYQKNVVMKYIDNLIAWGDQLFRRDTIESINEATQLYILAAEILGKRPQSMPAAKPVVQTFNTLQKIPLDPFTNALVAIEDKLGKSVVPGAQTKSAAPLPQLLYFGVPKNDKLLGYWDTVADRLFKIRHCMNIEGVARQLPLFEPPIDPALLVKAAAAGVDLSSVLNDMTAPLPHYRFQFMLQKAIELCGDVKALGAALLATLEKKDAEELALLRSGQEITLLRAVKEIKQNQINQALENIASLEETQGLSKLKTSYYQEKLGLESKPEKGKLPAVGNLKLIPQEKQQMEKLASANIKQADAMQYEFAAQLYSLYPDITLGTSGSMGSPVVTAQIGGSLFAQAMRAIASEKNMGSASDSAESNRAGIMAGFFRQAQELGLQIALSVQEEAQIDKQLLAARLQHAIAVKELENHDLQTENAKVVDAYMREKFTNKELYNWMLSQISSTYFQSYQMAYDLAKRAERAFQHELGKYETSLINFGYWDSLKKGLLAGEKLHYDLKRMEVAYMEQNKREYELTKSISLAMLDPIALINLKETGECFVNLPEEVFDLDYAGHYFRRVKSVRLTIPCVTGPHTTVNCTLTLLSNSLRTGNTLLDGQYRRQEEGETRFRDNVGAIQSIATSSAQNDAGLFELNFRDERYLPFEGAGAISSWRIELTKDRDLRQFDYDTITDVIVHASYTAREGGGQLKQAAVQSLKDTIQNRLMKLAESRQGLYQLLSMRQEFSSPWHKFLHPAGEGTPHRLQVNIGKERFPFMFQERDIVLHASTFFLKLKGAVPGTFSLPFTLAIAAGTPNPQTFTPNENGIPVKQVSTGLQFGQWVIEITDADFSALGDDQIEDIWLAVNYAAEVSS